MIDLFVPLIQTLCSHVTLLTLEYSLETYSYNGSINMELKSLMLQHLEGFRLYCYCYAEGSCPLTIVTVKNSKTNINNNCNPKPFVWQQQLTFILETEQCRCKWLGAFQEHRWIILFICSSHIVFCSYPSKQGSSSQEHICLIINVLFLMILHWFSLKYK